jgi:hypothetical protein
MEIKCDINRELQELNGMERPVRHVSERELIALDLGVSPGVVVPAPQANVAAAVQFRNWKWEADAMKDKGDKRLCLYVFVVVFMSLLLCCVFVHLHPNTLGEFTHFHVCLHTAPADFACSASTKACCSATRKKNDEDRTIIDLEWSNRAWVVVSQLSPLTHNEGDITDDGDDSNREGHVINGFLCRMIAASNLNAKHVQALGGDLPLPESPSSM